MRKLNVAALAATVVSLAGPAFAGDVTVNGGSKLTATVAGKTGNQTATSAGLYSIAQAGTSSVEAAGQANITLNNATVTLSSNQTGAGTNTANAIGNYSVAQAGLASIQAAEACGCGP